MAVEGRSERRQLKCQALQKNYHVTKILQTETVSKGIPCQQFDETGEHMSSGKRTTTHTETRLCVCSSTLQHMHGNWGKVRQ
jgi:hypothetical protein